MLDYSNVMFYLCVILMCAHSYLIYRFAKKRPELYGKFDKLSTITGIVLVISMLPLLVLYIFPSAGLTMLVNITETITCVVAIGVLLRTLYLYSRKANYN